jgi:hypothetical protein
MNFRSFVETSFSTPVPKAVNWLFDRSLSFLMGTPLAIAGAFSMVDAGPPANPSTPAVLMIIITIISTMPTTGEAVSSRGSDYAIVCFISHRFLSGSDLHLGLGNRPPRVVDKAQDEALADGVRVLETVVPMP